MTPATVSGSSSPSAEAARFTRRTPCVLRPITEIPLTGMRIIWPRAGHDHQLVAVDDFLDRDDVRRSDRWS